MFSLSAVLWQASISMVLAAPSVSFSVSKGISSKRGPGLTTVQTKLNGSVYSIDVNVPSNYPAPSGDSNLYQVEAKSQLSDLKQQYTSVGILSSSDDAELADMLVRSLKVHTDASKFSAEVADMEPLLPHNIFQIMALDDAEKKAEDVVDTRSVALLTALATSCDLVKYPLNNPNGVAYEYGVWCNGSSYSKGKSIHNGVLLGPHLDLVYPSLGPKDVRRWEDGEALKFVYGKENQSDTLIPTGNAPSTEDTDTPEDPNTQNEPKDTNKPKSKTDSSPRDTSMDIFYILGGFAVIGLFGYGIYNSNRKKRIAELKQELHKEEEEF